ncbi:MAG TPA: hypothetical protein VIG51_04925 [Candidatus Baltobacteraceae bacterium]
MNLSRAILLPAAFGLALAVPAAAFAQVAPAPPAAQTAPAGSRHHGGHHHRGWMRAMRGITLSTQQKTQLKAIRTSYRQAHPKGSARDPQAMQQMRTQMLNVLTPAQRTQYQQNLQQQRQERPATAPSPNP